MTSRVPYSSTAADRPIGTRDYSRFVSPSTHPGEHLREDYLADYDLTAETLAAALGLDDVQIVHDLLGERSTVTADLALRLGRLFSQSPEMWLGLQTGHDLSKAAIASRGKLDHIRPLAAA